MGVYMAGKFYSCVRFPLFLEGCRRSWIAMEPKLTTSGYAVQLKVEAEMIKGNEKKGTYPIIRDLDISIITQTDVGQDTHNPHSETMMEFFEGFYYHRTPTDMVVPMCALILATYYRDWIERYSLDLSEYVDIMEEIQYPSMGFRK